MMKLQVLLISCFLFAGSSANPSRHETEIDDSDDLRLLLAEFSDATAKWSSLYDKFEKVKSSDCGEPENSPVCKAIEEEARTVTDKLGGNRKEETDGDLRILNGILSSLQEKVEKIERKMETGVGGTISTRDYIQAMRGLERRLHYFQAAIATIGKEAKSPMRYVDGTDEDDAVGEVRHERASGRVYDEEEKSVKHGGKSGKTVAVPYKKLLSAIERLEEVVENVKNCGAKNQVGQYKNSIFKDIKDMLEDISEDIKSLRKMSSREMNENEKILRKINKKLERELKDDDKDDEDLKRSLKKYMVEQRKELEKAIKKALSKRSDDTDDSDEKGKGDDSDEEEDESCDDSDGCDRKKKGRDNDESDDNDEDEEETDDDKGRKRGKDETDDSDETDETDDTDEDDRKGRKKKNRENLTKKYSALDEEDVEVLRNSASGGPFGKNKFVTSLFGIPPYIDH